jgi:3-hexulose-6-phosphate synthase
LLADQGLLEVVIVGSKITKAENPLKAVNEFMGAVHK